MPSLILSIYALDGAEVVKMADGQNDSLPSKEELERMLLQAQIRQTDTQTDKIMSEISKLEKDMQMTPFSLIFASLSGLTVAILALVEGVKWVAKEIMQRIN